VTADSASVWARANQPSRLKFEFATAPSHPCVGPAARSFPSAVCWRLIRRPVPTSPPGDHCHCRT